MPRREATLDELKQLKTDAEALLERAKGFTHLAFVEGDLEDTISDLEDEIADREELAKESAS